MANVDGAFGLRPVQYLNGTPWNGGARMYCIPSSDSTYAYAIGDPVVSDSGADANGIPTVTLATAGGGNLVRGAIVGMGGTKYGSHGGDPANLNLTVIPAAKSQDYYVLVADDPNIIFEIQEEDAGTAFTAATVGLNANLSSGTNNGYVSGWEIDTASPATTATLQLRLLQLAPRPGNAFGDWAKWWVLINYHELTHQGAGV